MHSWQLKPARIHLKKRTRLLLKTTLEDCQAKIICPPLWAIYNLSKAWSKACLQPGTQICSRTNHYKTNSYSTYWTISPSIGKMISMAARTVRNQKINSLKEQQNLAIPWFTYAPVSLTNWPSVAGRECNSLPWLSYAIRLVYQTYLSPTGYLLKIKHPNL